MKQDKQYWFPAKEPGMGWGWGVPNAWQGWVVLLGYMLLMVVGSALLVQHHAVWFAVWVGGLTAALMAICFLKGEPPGPLGGR
jgi:hypothetical protein